MRPILDPRDGDIEDDASSTHQRSLLSLAGSLFSEISLPKLIVVWVLLLVVPALLLGVAPLSGQLHFRIKPGGGRDRRCPIRPAETCRATPPSSHPSA